MSSRSALFALFLALPLLAACDDVFTVVACTAIAVPAIEVTAVDSVTSELIDNPLVWVRAGSFVDTLRVSDFDGVARGAHEHPGTYDVHVEADGYQDWLETGVVVEDGECHVQTEEITARLQTAG